MSPKSQRSLGATLIALIALGYTPSVSSAVPVPVFTESFETCTIPGTSPYYTGYPTATAATEPIYVNLWINSTIDCPDWEADGQAWLAQHDYGGAFPDGDLAAWLNEGQSGSPAAGSISRDITGLTAGNDYTLSLETWTDDQDEPTSLTVNVTNGANVQTYQLDLDAGEGIQALSDTFSAYGGTITLELIGSAETAASPLIDNIRISDAGPTPEDPDDPDDSVSRPTNRELAQTGFNPASLLGLSGLLVVVGAGFLALRRRISRRTK